MKLNRRTAKAIFRRRLSRENGFSAYSAFISLSLTVMALLIATSASAQISPKALTFQDKNHSTIGYAKDDGTLQDGSYGIVGYVKTDGTVQDKSYGILGYIKTDGTVQDKNYGIIGYIKPDGTIQDKNYSILGYIRADGVIQNKDYGVVGYYKDGDLADRHLVGAFVFFFSDIVKTK